MLHAQYARDETETYSMQKDQRRTSNVMCIFYATTRISIVQDAFMQYV